MNFLEGWFGGGKSKDIRTNPASLETGIELDKTDMEANDAANRVKSEAVQRRDMTDFIKGSIEDILKKHPDRFSTGMSLYEFNKALEDMKGDHEVWSLKSKLERFLDSEENKEKAGRISTFKELVEWIDRENLKSDQIIHPERYTRFHDEV